MVGEIQGEKTSVQVIIVINFFVGSLGSASQDHLAIKEQLWLCCGLSDGSM